LLPIITSCSQQKFAFRKTIKVKQTEQAATQKSESEVAYESKPTQLNDLIVPSNQEESAVANTSQPEITTEEASVAAVAPIIESATKWKQAETEKKESSTTPNNAKKMLAGGNGLAVAGFVLALCGLFIAAIPFGILAIIFGVLGLKSSRKGLAIAAIIIGAVDLILGLIIVSQM
jgi:hypothetical protein